MSAKGQVRVERSAGGAVIGMRDGIPWVVMIATRGKTRWGLPKGAANHGETKEAAAVREVEEETGLIAEVLEPLETIEYFFRGRGDLIHKYVDFYLMACRGGTLRPQLSEVDDAEWVPLTTALEKASFPTEKKMIEKLLGIWSAMPDEKKQGFSPLPQ